MYLGQGIERDLEKAMDQGRRKKPLSDFEKERRRREVFERWFDEKIEVRYRDPAKG